VFEEVTCIDLMKERGDILEFVDVHLFYCDADELLAAVLSYLPNLFGASFVDGLGLFHLDYCCVFSNLVIPEAKALGDGRCNAGVVGHVGRLCSHNPYYMIKSIIPVIGDGLQDVKELFSEGEGCPHLVG
jgi:hypothetical protein